MAAYKVPQDVEAEDKLIGPFSFRQFIYLIIAALGLFLAWALSRVFIGLLIVPLPIVIAFLALALPLRKDQPMETYLIAMIKFFFKPRKRLWDPEGTISLVQITTPRVTEGPQLKGFNSEEASQRLSYLAQVVDTRGWSTRGANSANDSLSDIFVAEASHAQDVLDETSGVAQALNQRIAASDDARMQAARDQMQAMLSQPPTPDPAQQTPTQDPAQTAPTQAVAAGPYQPATDTGEIAPDLRYDPYPNSMHQQVIQPSTPPTPVADKAQAENQPSSEVVSPDIMRLANNNDLSISAIANEVHRLKDTDDEVIVSLR